MTEPTAPTTQDFINAADALITLREDLTLDKEQINKYQMGVRAIIGQLQVLAFSFADATAQSYLGTNRAFMTNTTLADIDVLFNGVVYTVGNGDIWCVDKGELDFFLGTVNYDGTLAQTTLAAWIAGGASTKVGAVYW